MKLDYLCTILFCPWAICTPPYLFVININTPSLLTSSPQPLRFSMSSHAFIVKDQLDQENKHQTVHYKENGATVPIAPAKRPLSKGLLLNEKRMRVPLSGKNQNLHTSLQRSKSFIPQNGPGGSSSQAPQPFLSGTMAFAPVLSLKPVLAKSNSTLGFFPQQASKTNSVVIKDTNPHKNEAFPALDAHRVKELVPLFATDKIKKQSGPWLPTPELTLQETFSDRITLMHASNLPDSGPSLQFRDPVKKSFYSIEQLIEALADDEDSIEITPIRDLPPLREKVPGYSPLRKSELDLLHSGHKPLLREESISFDSSDNESEKNRLYQIELENSGQLGLSLKDLEDLLEF